MFNNFVVKLARLIRRKIVSLLWHIYYKCNLVINKVLQLINSAIQNTKRIIIDFPDLFTIFFTRLILPKVILIRFKKSKFDPNLLKGKKIALIPYQSPDCIIQHNLIANILNNYGASCTIIRPSIPNNPTNSPQELVTRKFDSFENIIKQIVSIFGHNPIFTRGIIDQFVRMCDVSIFKENYELSSSFLEEAYSIDSYSKSLVNPFDAVILADTAYSLNRGIRSHAHSSNIPIFALNPHGQSKLITQLEDENISLVRFDQILDILKAEDNSAFIEAQEYLRERFSGKSISDLDSRKVFANNKSTTAASATRKKVLFLHSFRDASGLSFPNNDEELFFPTYFEWTNAALELISKQQDQWLIKPHPSQGHYPNDIEILDFLLEKHKISNSIVRCDLSTPEILANKWLIYTCSGTIAQEAACFGFKAHTVSARIPDQISKRAKTAEEFKSDYLKPPGSDSELIEDANLCKAAQIFFAEQYSGSQLYAKSISPKNPVLPSLSSLYIYWQKIRSLYQMAYISCSYRGFFSAIKFAQEIIEVIKLKENQKIA